jgi:hypothetical protein
MIIQFLCGGVRMELQIILFSQQEPGVSARIGNAGQGKGSPGCRLK